MVQLHTFSLYESKRADLSVSQPTSSTKNPNSRIKNSSGGGGIIKLELNTTDMRSN